MARRKVKREEEVQSGGIVAMIDVVFQLIIFFVCSVAMQQQLDDRIVMPNAPNSEPVKTPPRHEFRINIDRNGVVDLGGQKCGDDNYLSAMVARAMQQAGEGADLPVTIRADVATRHRAVKKVMDTCSRAGVSHIKIVAIQKAVNKN